jgi:hypothetical protein
VLPPLNDAVCMLQYDNTYSILETTLLYCNAYTLSIKLYNINHTILTRHNYAKVNYTFLTVVARHDLHDHTKQKTPPIQITRPATSR